MIMKSNPTTFLRCAWVGHPEHPADATLKLIGDNISGLLQCRGCQAVFMLDKGNPVMLSNAELTADDQKIISERKRLFGLA